MAKAKAVMPYYSKDACCPNCTHHGESRPIRQEDSTEPARITHITCKHPTHRGNGPVPIQEHCVNFAKTKPLG